MEKIVVKDKVFRKYLEYKEIQEAIDRLSERVNNDYRDMEEVPILLCVLNGAIMFTAELMKRLEFDVELVSVKLSSYQGTQSTGTVLNVMGFTGSVKNRNVIVCEDIIDTGGTIIALKEMLVSQGAKDVRICTMLLKPDVYNQTEKIDYIGKEIPNDFIVGFGLDYDEQGRNYKDIYVLDKQ